MTGACRSTVDESAPSSSPESIGRAMVNGHSNNVTRLCSRWCDERWKLPPVDQLEGSYLWPHTLRRAKPPPKLVYLDLNHWIALAKALVGHRDGRPHKDVLAACIRAVEGGSAIFPISDTIYFEVSKIGPYRQRRDLREVIEKVSRHFVVIARSVISVHEIEALLDRIVGPNPEPINTMFTALGSAMSTPSSIVGER
jgi:hypothetical protein